MGSCEAIAERAPGAGEGSMKVSAEEFILYAKGQGVSDVCFVRPDPFVIWQKDADKHLYGVHQSPLCADPKELMEDAKSVAVLFFAAPPFTEEDAPYPRYYIQSQRAFLATRALSGYLHNHGIKTVMGTKLPHRSAALRSGGMIGENGLYYHPALGSHVHIELIVNDEFSPEPEGIVSECAHCGRCAKACPTGAISGEGLAMRHCLRNHLYTEDMPESFRPHILQLLGCERCQRVCPQNQTVVSLPIQADEREALSPETLLRGSLKGAKELIGSNYARRRHMSSQALLYIGARGLKEYRTILESMRETLPEGYLHWTLSRLIDENHRI